VAFCPGLRFVLDCVLSQKSCVLSSKILRFALEALHFVFKDLAFALEALRFVYFKDLAFCLRNTAFCLLQRSCVLSQKHCDNDMQKNLALIAKYFKKIYKPTNNNLRTSSNSRNKNVDTTLGYKNDNQSGQFRNQRMVNVVGARENTEFEKYKAFDDRTVDMTNLN
nr:hypothetical protein [Tanacetum cinerariifolium]